MLNPSRILSGPFALLVLLMLTCNGCKSVSITEVRGRTAFGPEFRNFGTNTHDIRYYVRQGVEAKLSNDWTTGVMYQRRDIDEGSGDNENLVLFEIGYPIWKKPKEPEKAALQIQDLERELLDLSALLAEAESQDGLSRFANVEGLTHENSDERKTGYAHP